jgi:hypothetical protein
MRNIFPGYYPPTDDEFKEMWGKGLFILDANVLLNLYRYPQKAREDLLSVFSKLEKRVWIPFHAALEFQKNRPTVIAEQKRRFYEAKQVASNAIGALESEFAKMQLRERHSLIDPDVLISQIKPSFRSFTEKLEELERSHSNVNDEDTIRIIVDRIFGKNIGPAPSKEFIENVIKDGEARFTSRMPPGYLDEKKGESKAASYSYGGVTYQGKFGDLIVWKQIIDHAKSLNGKPIIFITDDEKEDWWWTIESQGKKRLGPRPELIEEIIREGNIGNFYMYNSENFLRYANDYLKVDVSIESIDQVRSATKFRTNSESNKIVVDRIESLRIASSWIDTDEMYEIDNKIITAVDFARLRKDGKRIGFEVVTQTSNEKTPPKITSSINFGSIDFLDDSIDHLEIIVIASSIQGAKNITPSIKKIENPTSYSIAITLGILEKPSIEEPICFTPLERIEI